MTLFRGSEKRMADGEISVTFNSKLLILHIHLRIDPFFTSLKVFVFYPKSRPAAEKQEKCDKTFLFKAVRLAACEP